MESENKVGFTENKSGRNDGQRINDVYGTFFVLNFILRLLVVASTFSAVIVMGTDKQTTMLPFVGPSSAKYQYSPAFVFFVVANAVACGYTLISLILSVSGKFTSSTLSAFLLSVTDLLMVALVSSGASAAAAFAYVGYKGNSHTQWGKLCGIYDRFCNHVIGALTASFASLIILLVLTVMNIYSIYRRTSSAPTV